MAQTRGQATACHGKMRRLVVFLNSGLAAGIAVDGCLTFYGTAKGNKELWRHAVGAAIPAEAKRLDDGKTRWATAATVPAAADALCRALDAGEAAVVAQGKDRKSSLIEVHKSDAHGGAEVSRVSYRSFFFVFVLLDVVL